MGKFHQFLTELSAHHMSAFSFTDDNLSNFKLIFTKLGKFIDITEIADARHCPSPHDSGGILLFHVFIFT